MLRKLKYVIFLVFVILLPLFLTDVMGQGRSLFLQADLSGGNSGGGTCHLVLLNKAMRGAIGWLYIWKNTILIVTIVLSIMIYRPFCKYICPLGAFYSIFNRVSIFPLPCGYGQMCSLWKMCKGLPDGSKSCGKPQQL